MTNHVISAIFQQITFALLRLFNRMKTRKNNKRTATQHNLLYGTYEKLRLRSDCAVRSLT